MIGATNSGGSFVAPTSEQSQVVVGRIDIVAQNSQHSDPYVGPFFECSLEGLAADEANLARRARNGGELVPMMQNDRAQAEKLSRLGNARVIHRATATAELHIDGPGTKHVNPQGRLAFSKNCFIRAAELDLLEIGTRCFNQACAHTVTIGDRWSRTCDDRYSSLCAQVVTSD